MLTCTACKTKKTLDEFHKDASSPRGRAYYCKFCANARTREWTKKNGRDVEGQRAFYLKRTYGITPQEYENLLIVQKYKCSICKTALMGGGQTHLDHDHKTKKIRGMLCTNCNRALGHFKDNVNILKEAIEYLETANWM